MTVFPFLSILFVLNVLGVLILKFQSSLWCFSCLSCQTNRSHHLVSFFCFSVCVCLSGFKSSCKLGSDPSGRDAEQDEEPAGAVRVRHHGAHSQVLLGEDQRTEVGVRGIRHLVDGTQVLLGEDQRTEGGTTRGIRHLEGGHQVLLGEDQRTEVGTRGIRHLVGGAKLLLGEDQRKEVSIGGIIDTW